MWDRATPAITTMLRGLVLEEVVIHGADRDLHSGIFGGAAVNPIHVLARIISGLHDERRAAVTLPGFYDGVSRIARGRRRAMAQSALSARLSFSAPSGFPIPAGEAGPQRAWRWCGRVRPATSTASSAAIRAKDRRRCCRRRRAPNSRSGSSAIRIRRKIAESFRAYVRKNLPGDCRAEFIPHGASRALQLPFSSEELSRASRALQAEWGEEPVLAGCGGSIPIVGNFKTDLNMDTLMIGFGLEDDRSPFAEREIRTEFVPQGRPQLGAGPARAGAVTRLGASSPAVRWFGRLRLGARGAAQLDAGDAQARDHNGAIDERAAGAEQQKLDTS